MKTKRLLIALAAVLLSCGITNAQTEGNDVNEVKAVVQGDANKDGVVNVVDVPILADSIINNKLSDLERLDLNEDQKVNAADVTLLIKKIQNANYFYLGTEVPTKDGYTTTEGVVTDYESIIKVLEAAPTIKVTAEKTAILLCPLSWDAKIWCFRTRKTVTSTI